MSNTKKMTVKEAYTLLDSASGEIYDQVFYDDRPYEFSREDYDALEMAIEALKKSSPAQPELIRCKDCKHYDDGLCRRWKYSHVTSEDSFCSGAERRNGWEE